ncbi:MAG: ATP-binding protein [Stappiaceae bacterium]
MTAFSRTIRTTAFKLSAMYVAAFMGMSIILVVYIGQNSVSIMSEQVDETIRSEVNALSDQYRLGGIRRLVRAVDRRSRQPGASLYLVTDFAGNVLAGNISRLPAGVLDEADGRNLQVTYKHLQRETEPAERENTNRALREITTPEKTQEAIVRVFELAGGFRVLVGRDIGESKRFREMLASALRLALVGMVIVAAIGWLFIGRRVLKRIDSVADTSRTIMAGDLTERLQVTGSGDEFDRLAISLNAMLERIESLMYGLKEVSDNIAHDLKTPLTRLRNRLEAALREDQDTANYRDTVQSTIEEADHLIRIFNALLRIARVEAGSPDQDREDIDLSDIVREVSELYEPVAEEEGVEFTLGECQTVIVHGSRELIAQALTNLLDNALKYGRRPDDGPSTISVSLEVSDKEAAIVVADNGPGIADADREKVCQRFFRLEQSRSAPGSGLGLSLVNAVAGLHEGTLLLEDNQPGLKITLKLPLSGVLKT